MDHILRDIYFPGLKVFGSIFGEEFNPKYELTIITKYNQEHSVKILHLKISQADIILKISFKSEKEVPSGGWWLERCTQDFQGGENVQNLILGGGYSVT